MTHRALPVRSLNVGTGAEQVTFEIKPLDDISIPSIYKLIWFLVRPTTLILSLGPMLAALFFCFLHDLAVNGAVALSSFVGVLLFHIALNLFNDYSDHIRGQDRLRATGGTRVIQRGWVRAFEVRRVAWLLLALAVVCALPAVVLHFAPVAIVGGIAFLVGLEFAFQKLRLKYRGFAEILAFVLTGPLLMCGFTWAVTGQVLWYELGLGSIFGAVSLMYFHSANFENIMTDSQAGVRTWATRAGFDASKKFFYFAVALTLTFSALYVFLLEKEVRLLPVFLAQVLLLLPVSLRVKKLASPLSSELTGLRAEALKLNWITLIAFVGGCFWSVFSRV